MGWASSAAARVRDTHEEVLTSQRIASEARHIIAANAETMWGNLVAALELCTKEFVDELPLAKEKNLMAVRLGRDNLTIQTSVYPLLKFEISFIRNRNVVTGRITENMSALGAPRFSTLNDIGMTVDRNLQPYFTDGERPLAAMPLAEELMEQVLVFFQRASTVPSFLA
jgi:hypothetical protein